MNWECALFILFPYLQSNHCHGNGLTLGQSLSSSKSFSQIKKKKRNKKKSNKNLNASCINKILIACFDLLASLSLDWPSSIHLPESSSTGACFWEILSFFFKFIWSLLNHFWVPCAILFLASASQWMIKADFFHLNLKYQILSLKKKGEGEVVCLCMSSDRERLAFRSWKGEKETLCIFFFLPVKTLWRVKSYPGCMCEYLLHMN